MPAFSAQVLEREHDRARDAEGSKHAAALSELRSAKEEVEAQLEVTRRELETTLEVLTGIEEEVASLKAAEAGEVASLRKALLASDAARRAAEISAQKIGEEVVSLREAEACLREYVRGLEEEVGAERERAGDRARECVALEG